MRTACPVRAAALTTACALTLAACGGSSAGKPSLPTTPVAAATPVSAPTAAPPVTGSSICGRFDDGVVTAQCARGSARYYDAVAGSIDRLIKQRPQLFNLNDVAADGTYRVVDVEGYYKALVDSLAAAGVCAQMDLANTYLQVKGSDEFSEDYQVLTSRNFTTSGAWIYRDTCTPASFPLTPADSISYVRVSFFGFRCNPGVVSPNRGDTLLPLGCDGYATATPKDPNGRDVPQPVYGREIAWSVKKGDGLVGLRPWPDEPFNQTVQPVALGAFKLCATVQGVTGCMAAEVVP